MCLRLIAHQTQTPTCTLTLNINGSALPANNLSGGPSLCQTNLDGTPNASQCYQPDPNDVLVITRTTAPGGMPATTASSTCGSTLTAGATCTITVTPGINPTSNCNTGSAPTPGTITVSATNVTTPATSNVVVLSYGCQYQGGFLYSVDDSYTNHPATGSIGGKKQGNPTGHHQAMTRIFESLINKMSASPGLQSHEKSQSKSRVSDLFFSSRIRISKQWLLTLL